MVENSREKNNVQLLFEISQILEGSVDIRDTLSPVLVAIAEHMNIERGMLTLLNRDTGEISIESAYGFSEKEKKKGKYRVGEGITGKVVKTGKAVIIPRISEEPMFLDRTGARKKLSKAELSFVCVPIKLGVEVIGTLNADRQFVSEEALHEDVQLFQVVVAMIAQAVKLRQQIKEEHDRLKEENLRLQEELESRFRPSTIIGNSAAMQDVYDLMGQVLKTNASILILGESGTGKEMIASAIHYNSLRAKKSFIKVNCAALPENVLESELFGHEEGAFTGASKRRKGRFELAHGGTIFLDEIGDISPAVQIKLLRVLQEREFERVGGSETIKIDVRVITATNRDLEAFIDQGRFREDLYYRLNVFPIHVPPLRERKTDILQLANFFVEKYSDMNMKNIKRISTPSIDMLMAYHWPGNVRELENCIERAVIVSNDEVIHGHHLPPTLQTAEASGTENPQSLPEALDRLEREMLMDAIKSSRGNMAKAAEKLGITQRLIGIRVKKHDIDYRRFRGN